MKSVVRSAYCVLAASSAHIRGEEKQLLCHLSRSRQRRSVLRELADYSCFDEYHVDIGMIVRVSCMLDQPIKRPSHIGYVVLLPSIGKFRICPCYLPESEEHTVTPLPTGCKSNLRSNPGAHIVYQLLSRKGSKHPFRRSQLGFY